MSEATERGRRLGEIAHRLGMALKEAVDTAGVDDELIEELVNDLWDDQKVPFQLRARSGVRR